jgi:hypothetical protein
MSKLTERSGTQSPSVPATTIMEQEERELWEKSKQYTTGSTHNPRKPWQRSHALYANTAAESMRNIARNVVVLSNSNDARSSTTGANIPTKDTVGNKMAIIEAMSGQPKLATKRPHEKEGLRIGHILSTKQVSRMAAPQKKRTTFHPRPHTRTECIQLYLPHCRNSFPTRSFLLRGMSHTHLKRCETNYSQAEVAGTTITGEEDKDNINARSESLLEHVVLGFTPIILGINPPPLCWDYKTKASNEMATTEEY